MNAGALLNTALDECGPESVLNVALVKRFSGLRQSQMSTSFGRENEKGIAMSGPELSKQFESSGRKRDISIFCAFAMSDVNHVASSIDVLNLKMSSLLKSKSAGVNGGDADAIGGKLDEAKNASNFLGAENDRKLLFSRRTNDVESRQVFVQNLLEEEPDAAKSDGGGTSRIFLDVSDVKEILAEFLIRDELRRFVKVLGEKANGADV